MGVFDKKYPKATRASYAPGNEQEAWIAIMHACIAVDEDVADEELEELAQALAYKPIFEGHDVREYYKAVLLAHARIGSKQLIDNSVEYISAERKYDLFALTIELVLADGVLANKEEELISYISSALDLDEETARKIVDKRLQDYKNNSAL
ncbi:TerB family tellurite resistance protein [Pontibacter diazotrophicus]|uniref:TerB family tellurite resistance protein n=1 Tax=Pontibacter diazotrophicus TaxID=1400979 RepID=A0A3D8LAS2_9BACT|nr:TerB family tellurite resistance protein [Pontibacter diazotrophicus]RDV14488.1 TerB family tellurite resistance protein [Pontibacter diazotrophicus]